MSESEKVFSNRLRELRKNAGLTQEKFKNLVGVSLMTLKRWESGIISPRIDELKRIAEVLNISEEQLINEPAKQEFEVKIIMGVKNLTNVLGLEIDDNSFFYGIDDNKPQIHIGGKIGIATEEDRKKSLNELIQKFWKACWMYDHKNEAENHEAKS